MRIGIVGGGAAGFFAALRVKEINPKAEVIIFEKSAKVLSKVKVSGGGRCNVTNATYDVKLLSNHYPRGERFLRKAFEQFSARDTVNWFESRGVPLETYPDNCIFPKANSSQVIIDCFVQRATEFGVIIRLSTPIITIDKQEGKFRLVTWKDEIICDRVICTIGGQPKISGFSLFDTLQLKLIPPVPSLFTFCIEDTLLTELMGVVVEKTTVRIPSTKLTGVGPLLITHWGMSGPAILQLSAWGARILHDKNYRFEILVNWLDTMKEHQLRIEWEQLFPKSNERQISNYNPFGFSNRLWNFLLTRADVNKETKVKELGKNQVNRLINTLLNDSYFVNGKTTYKEEFVTAGGVSLDTIDVATMESKLHSGLYFAGESMDVDGITGGFNFQAAWTTAYIAGSNAAV